MEKHFICLANSYKRGGRCIAGIEIHIGDDDQFTILRHPNGRPQWVRPIASTTEYGEIPEGEAQHIHLLSVVKLSGVIPSPSEAHSEDANYNTMMVVGTVLPTHTVFSQLTDNVHTSLFYTTDYFITPKVYANGYYSLMLIHPAGFTFRLDPSKKRAKYYLVFSYYGVTYDLSITDPDFYRFIEQHPDDWNNVSDIYLSLSIGMVYEGLHHKLIAAVLTPSENSNSDKLRIIRNDTLQELSARRLTFRERLLCKQAIVIPSYNGLSVLFKMWNGKESFIPIDSKSNLSVWQKIKLRKAYIVTYEDALGNRLERLRIL